MYTLLMDEGIKNEEKELEESPKKVAINEEEKSRESKTKGTSKHTRGSTKNKRNIQQVWKRMKK